MPLSLASKLALEDSGLQTDHRAADDLRLVVHFADRLHDTDRTERIRADDHDVRIGRLYRTDDGRVVRRGRRIFPVIDDLHIELLCVLARAVAGVVGELGILDHQRDRRWLWILLLGDLEDAFGEGRLGLRTRWQHREVFRIFELVVHIECKQADEGLALLHHHRQRWRDHVGRVAADHEIDFVDVEQLGVDAGHRRGIALVIVVNQLDRASEQSAFGVYFFFPDLHAQQRLLAVCGERTGLRHAEADLDRLLVLRRRGADEHGASRDGKSRSRRITPMSGT